MGIETIALAVGIGGLATQGVSAVMQADARKDATAASRRAERLREQQMQLESQRKQRELIRQEQNARDIALSRSVAQGAGQGDQASSSLFGAYGQIQGALGRASNTEEQNLDIGAGIFSANRDLASAQGDVATWEGVGKFGQSLVSNSQMIGKIGNNLFGESTNYGATPRTPQSLFSTGTQYPGGYF